MNAAQEAAATGNVLMSGAIMLGAALLFVTLTLGSICWPGGRTSVILAAAALAALAVLSHNVTVAVFVLLPVDTPGGSSCVTWLAQPVNPGNAYTFGWPPTWGFAWAASGTRQARSWAASGTLPADPTAPEGCAALSPHRV